MARFLDNSKVSKPAFVNNAQHQHDGAREIERETDRQTDRQTESERKRR